MSWDSSIQGRLSLLRCIAATRRTGSDTDDAFRFSIPNGIRETDGGDFTSVLRYAYRPDDAQPLPLFEATGKCVVGSADRNNFTNNAGTKGPLFGRSELDASTLSFYVGLTIPIGEVFTVSPAVDISYSRTYDGWSPSLGVTIRPMENHMVFAAASRSFEPPTHDDLIAPVNGTPNRSAG